MKTKLKSGLTGIILMPAVLTQTNKRIDCYV